MSKILLEGYDSPYPCWFSFQSLLALNGVEFEDDITYNIYERILDR